MLASLARRPLTAFPRRQTAAQQNLHLMLHRAHCMSAPQQMACKSAHVLPMACCRAAVALNLIPLQLQQAPLVLQLIIAAQAPLQGQNREQRQNRKQARLALMQARCLPPQRQMGCLFRTSAALQMLLHRRERMPHLHPTLL